MLIKYRGIEIELKQLPNGKYKKPDIAQFTKSGFGCTWLDDGRIPYKSNEDYSEYVKKRHSFDNQIGKKQTKDNTNVPLMASPYANTIQTQGRFPANLLVSDDVLNDGNVSKSIPHQGGLLSSNGSNEGWKRPSHKNGYKKEIVINDSGSFSRYFDLDKWFEERIKLLPRSVQKTFPFLIVPKASKSEKNKGLDNNITVKYNVSNGGALCKDEIMVAVQLLPKVISGLTAHWSKDEFGEGIMVLFRRDISSTILTETNRIIELKTLPLLMHSLTSEYTQDASGSTENGGSLAENVERLREYLLTITNGNRELALGASRVVLEMLLTISVRENWHENYNFHCAVKPLKLMSYLITLGSREGDLVLDPFAGSFTTALACQILNRRWIACDISEEYCKIGEGRLL